MEGTGERPVVEGDGAQGSTDVGRLEGYAVKAAAVAGLVLGLRCRT